MVTPEVGMKRILTMFALFGAFLMCVVYCTGTPEALRDYALPCTLILTTVPSWNSLNSVAPEVGMKRILTIFAPFGAFLMCVVYCPSAPEALRDYALGCTLVVTTVSSWYSFNAIWHAVFGPRNGYYGTSFGYVIISALSTFPLIWAKETFESETSHYAIYAGITLPCVLGVMHFLYCLIAFARTGDTEPFWRFWRELDSEISAVRDQYNKVKQERLNREKQGIVRNTAFSY